MKADSPSFSDSIPRAWVDSTYALMPREVESLDKIVYNVIRHRRIADKYFPTIPVPRGTRNRKIAIAEEMYEPIFDDDFLTEDIEVAKKTEHTFYLAFMHKDFRLNMIDIDASRNSKYYNISIEQLNLRETTKTIVDYRERVIWRGYDFLDKAKTAAGPQGLIDTQVQGIIGATNGAGTENSFAAAGDNAGINSAGDGPLSIGAAMASLIADQYYGPYVFVMTPDVYGQLSQNFNSTTHISDIERMMAMVDLHGQKILEGMDVSHYLINTAVGDSSNSYGSMLMFQRKTPEGEPTCIILEAYPVSHYPIQMSSLGIKGKVLWGGCAARLRDDAFTLETLIDLVA